MSEDDRGLINCIQTRFVDRPTDFEACAGALAKLLLRDLTDLEITRPWRDGGRDAIGGFALVETGRRSPLHLPLKQNVMYPEA